MLEKICKVARALNNAGIIYEMVTSYDSRTRLDTFVLKWTQDGRRVVYIEDEEGFTSFKIHNPSVSGIIAFIVGEDI